MRERGKGRRSLVLCAANVKRRHRRVNALLAKFRPYNVRIANAVWCDRTCAVKQPYTDAIDRFYGTGCVRFVDFRNDFEGSRERINAWVHEQTNERIKEIFGRDALDDGVAQNIRLILTSAIYFHGRWEEEFNPHATKDDDFMLAGGRAVPVLMMSIYSTKVAGYAAFNADGTAFNTPRWLPDEEQNGKKPPNLDPGYPDARGFAMIELPYCGGELSMLVMTPRSPDGLGRLEKMLSTANLRTWIRTLQEREVEVFVPKFELGREYRVKETLKQMGMVRAFNDAQLGAMCDSQDLHIGQVLHKASIGVNEKGTEAAAATGIEEKSLVSIPEGFKPTFRADRPFLFLIRDKTTGGILFIGRIVDPKA